MGVGRTGGLLAVMACTVLTGCVDRRYVVESNVPGGISVDGVPIGPAPCDNRWEYAGCYEFHAVAPNCEPLTRRVYFKPKWYQYPPFDFFAEVLWPGRIEDVRRVRLTLEPVRPIDQGMLLGAADQLRARATTLPPSSVPDEAPTRPTTSSPSLPPINSPIQPVPSNMPLPLPSGAAGDGPRDFLPAVPGMFAP